MSSVSNNPVDNVNKVTLPLRSVRVEATKQALIRTAGVSGVPEEGAVHAGGKQNGQMHKLQQDKRGDGSERGVG